MVVKMRQDIVESTQQIVSIHNHTVEEWSDRYQALLKHQDYQRGYFFSMAKSSLGKSMVELGKLIGVSQPTIANYMSLYRDVVELAEVAPEKTLPTSASKHAALKGVTPEEKADNYTKVRNETGKVHPTQRQIKAVMKSITAPVDVVVPAKVKLDEDGEEVIGILEPKLVDPILDIIEAYVRKNESLPRGEVIGERVIHLDDGTRVSLRIDIGGGF